MNNTEKYIVVGRIGKSHGIHGWLKIQSFTEPSDNIFKYLPWHIKKNQDWQVIEITQTAQRGDTLLVKFADCDTPEQASLLTNSEIAVFRDQLAVLQQNEYYWTDLIGLTVINKENIVLGTVDYIFETGANDVLVIKGEHDYLIPYAYGSIILKIDLPTKTITVDWDADFH